MDQRLKSLSRGLFFAAAMFVLFSCKDEGDQPPAADGTISTDAQLFALITQQQPFGSYALFPRADSVTSGTLNGSHAHQPLVRVSMNATALGALQNDTLPVGSSFPDGSIIFKQIMSGGQTTLYAVIYKDGDNSLAGNGWLWGEYEPDGDAFVSMTARGSGCVGCHALERGPQNDFVRTFERQY